MFHDPLALHAVQIDVDARVSFMRSLGGQEYEVALSHQEPDLIDGPMLPNSPNSRRVRTAAYSSRIAVTGFRRIARCAGR